MEAHEFENVRLAEGDGGVVRSVSDVTPGDQLKLRVADGEISCQVV